MKVGVFDSGVGGQSVVNAIHQDLPELEIVYADDKANVPYGDKSPDELYTLVLPILEDLVDQGCQAIIIACNTVSVTLISKLRDKIAILLIAMEPMVKPAALATKSNVIAICATPTTLASPRYKWLKETYAPDVAVLEPDCSDWANMIQSNQLDHDKISQRITDVCEKGADVIVLGCTHYHWIEKDIQKIADEFGAKVIQPELPVIRQLKRVIEQCA